MEPQTPYCMVYGSDLAAKDELKEEMTKRVGYPPVYQFQIGPAVAINAGPRMVGAHAAGPYNYQDIDITGKAVYTNNPPAGAFRGFGVTQSCFATECNIDKLAQLVGISPFEMRYINAIRPGQVLPNGQIADESTALVETLDAVIDDLYMVV